MQFIGQHGSGKVGVSLILKTLTNPYFVSMKRAAQAQAAKDNVRLSVAAGTADGDTQGQINAIDTAIARGDKGILITSNGDAVNAALRQAKRYGLFVIALDTPTNPIDTADITHATDNEAAGKLSPGSLSRETSAVPVSRKLLPLVTDGFAPPRASFAIDVTPRAAILPGYWVASAENSPLLTFCLPSQLPSIETTMTLFCLPAAFSAA